MKTLRKLPFVLAFVVTLFVGSCSDETALEPVNTDEKGDPLPPPPPDSSSILSDTTTID